MTRKFVQNSVWIWVPVAGLLAGAYACGSAGSDAKGSPGTGTGIDGTACAVGADCKSGVCNAGSCAGNGEKAPAYTPCTDGSTCSSGRCANGACALGQLLADGMSCTNAGECKSAACTHGICGTQGLPTGTGGAAATSQSGTGGAQSTTATTAPPFQGLGTNWRGLTPGCGPDTAGQCGGTCEQQNGDPTGKVIRPPAALCFGASADGGLDDPTPNDPAAVIEQVIETQNGVSYVHIRVTFDPAFCDNTYGDNASPGWYQTMDGKTGKGHTFSDLLGSDHVDLMLTNGAGETVIAFGQDYVHSLTGGKAPKGGTTTTIDAGSTSTCGGYTDLGVLGGEGSMTTGNSSDILATATSIDRNLNGCGYCQSAACAGDAGTGDCTVNSPATDEKYTPNPLTPNWNYDIVYESWINLAAFGSSGFGQAYITFVHCSPSKLSGNTLYVDPTPCPPGRFDTPDGGPPDQGPCVENYQPYTTLEGQQICTPIPFAGYPGMAPCPAGYQLDTASEGQFCVPIP